MSSTTHCGCDLDVFACSTVTDCLTYAFLRVRLARFDDLPFYVVQLTHLRGATKAVNLCNHSTVVSTTHPQVRPNLFHI